MTHAKIAMVVHGESAHRIQVGTTKHSTQATRGARKEFPSVAVIVLKDGKLTIYDGDDPDMPMWMVFNADASTAESILRFGSIGSAVALNGTLFVRLTNHYGATSLNFISEKALTYRDNGIHEFTEKQGLVDRNVTNSEPHNFGAPVLVSSTINGVAITVLNDAPIDSTTGLPIPTIALAADGGVSVIMNDGTIKSDSVLGLNNNATGITFQPNTSNIFFFVNGNHHFWADVNATTLNAAEISSNPQTGIPAYWSYWTGSDRSVHTDEHRIRSHNGGVTFYKDYNESAPTTSSTLSSVAYVTSYYNTGHMVGDIRVAALSDTSTTSTTGPELITNGTTFSNTTGWTGAGTTVSVSGGELVLTGTASINSNQSAGFTSIACSVGDQFLVTFDIAELVQNNASAGIIVGGATIRKGPGGGGYWYPASVGTHSTVIDATSTAFTLYLHAGIPVGVITKFDNISVHKLNEIDRTDKNNDLRVIGTMAKTVVATGADLVGYGPFSSSNYIQQPYTNHLDFDSGDFATCFWTNNAYSATQYIWDRSDDNGNHRIAIYISSSVGGTAHFYTRDGGGASTEVNSNGGLNPSGWSQVWCIRRGTSHEIWVDGVNRVQAVGTVRDVSSANGQAEFTIGSRYSNDNHNTGKLALIRITKTPPTAEQIAKIYSDEKKLFRNNAKATLYGSSDAVTALAYDDSTELLHVGTSAGRSVFQGLNRVDNTTDALKHCNQCKQRPSGRGINNDSKDYKT